MIVLPCFQRRGDDNPCDLLTQRCVNTAGSYRCVNLCASGLRHDPRTRECVDIDECQERNVRCQGGKVSQNCSKRQDYLEKADTSLCIQYERSESACKVFWHCLIYTRACQIFGMFGVTFLCVLLTKRKIMRPSLGRLGVIFDVGQASRANQSKEWFL